MVFVLLSGISALALDRVEAGRSNTMLSGRMTGATEYQFGVMVRGSLDQKIEQLSRELRLLQFARNSLPALLEDVTYSGTNRPVSECLAALSKKIGKPIPMELGTNDFLAKEFIFREITLMDALKYLAAFNDSILDVSNGKLVCKPVRQALALDESEYDLLRLMKMRQYETARQILDGKKVDVAKIRDPDGKNLLHLAVGQNHTPIAEKLIALGVNINAKDDVGYTPLHEAVRSGSRQCAELLLKNGADMSIVDNNGDTVLETAIYFGYLDIAKLLADNGAALDIYTASGLGKVDAVRKFLDQAAAVNTKRPDQEAKMGISSFNFPRKVPGGYYRTEGVTPLHWAARAGCVEVASLLVSRGQPVDAKDVNGESPLFWAADEGRQNITKFLIEHGANVNATNQFASTPLLTAARMKVSPELMKILIKAGADVKARDAQGENALHKLAWFGYPREGVEAAQILLDAGADIAVKNNEGKTPLDVLLENSLQNDDLVRLYREYTAKKSWKPGN